MKTDKPTTYRTSPENRKKLEGLWGNKNIGSARAVDCYLAIRGPILRQVEGKVDSRDIASLATVLAGTPMDPSFMASPKVLIGKITTRAEGLDEQDKQKKSNMLVLAEKVKTFTPWECYVLQEEVYRRIEHKS